MSKIEAVQLIDDILGKLKDEAETGWREHYDFSDNLKEIKIYIEKN